MRTEGRGIRKGKHDGASRRGSTRASIDDVSYSSFFCTHSHRGHVVQPIVCSGASPFKVPKHSGTGCGPKGWVTPVTSRSVAANLKQEFNFILPSTSIQ